MVALVDKIARDGGATREAVRKETAKPKPGLPKAYIFSYKAPTKAFRLQLRFTKSRVDRDEVIPALQNIIDASTSCARRRNRTAGAKTIQHRAARARGVAASEHVADAEQPTGIAATSRPDGRRPHRHGDPQKTVALFEKIPRDGGATREAVRKETAKPKPGRPKAYIFSYKAPTKAFKLQLRFARSRVERDEGLNRTRRGPIPGCQNNQPGIAPTSRPDGRRADCLGLIPVVGAVWGTSKPLSAGRHFLQIVAFRSS